jgi:site-specific recombinase XerD
VGEHLLCKQGVTGSNPVVSTSSYLSRPGDDSPARLSTEKAGAHPLQRAVDDFLLTKRVSNCAAGTLDIYERWVSQCVAVAPEADPLDVRRFFVGLQALSDTSRHQAYRTLKTFFRWCVETGVLEETPLRGFTMRTPRTLPDVPTDDELRSLLRACPETLEGVRNRTLILALADSGLRASEILHLVIEDWRPLDRGLFVRAGKGRKDRVAFVGPTTARMLKRWLAYHPAPAPEAFVFVDRRGHPLHRRHLVQILHRLSRKAGLPNHRRLHPHALRHYAATSWLRGGAGLDEVRRLLGHESLDTTLRYSRLMGADLARAHRAAGGIERLSLD